MCYVVMEAVCIEEYVMPFMVLLKQLIGLICRCLRDVVAIELGLLCRLKLDYACRGHIASLWLSE